MLNRARVTRATRRLFISVLAAFTFAGCEATPPVAPSPTLSRLVILFAGPTRADFVFRLLAYVVDSDGAYTDVTDKALWSVSNPAILRNDGPFVGGNSFLNLAPGTVSVLASYQGVSGLMTLQAPLRTNLVGPVTMAYLSGDLNGIGHTFRLDARDPQFKSV